MMPCPQTPSTRLLVPHLRPHGGIAAAFAVQASHAPGALAIAGPEVCLTYGELDALSDGIAARLRAAGLGPEKIVAVQAERGARLVAAWLGILKAGCAYLPLDPRQTPHRFAHVLRDCGAAFLLGIAAGAQAAFPDIPMLDLESEDFADGRGGFRDAEIAPGQLAYVMYTSGSTGAPKGIAIPQEAVLGLVFPPDYVAIAPGDRIAFASHPAFDAATFEVWGALLHGATLIVAPRDDMSDPARLAAFLDSEQVQTLFLTTPLFHLMVEHEPASLCGLENLLVGGDAMDADAARRLLTLGGPGRLLNMYGPTECTTFATWHCVGSLPAEAATVPIGRPIQAMRAIVVDEDGVRLPAGVAGELWLGGPGLARGYVGRPDLTAERFVPDRLGGGPGARFYRTGDRCAWRPDGALEFLGRLDRQVKLRGFRVEPGEIEAVLKSLGAVRDAVVAVEGAGAEKRLTAYVVGRSGRGEPVGALAALARSHIERLLPPYMHPSAYVILSKLPLSDTGKIDWRGLQRASGSPPGARGAPFRSNIGRRLAAIYCRLTGINAVCAEEDFFALGGHSLLAARLTREIRIEFGLELSIADIFLHPRLSDLAALIEARRFDEDPVALGYPRGIVPLRTGGAGTAFFCVAPAGGSPLCYRKLAAFMGGEFPFLGLQSQGLGDLGTPLRTVEEIAARHVASIREWQPRGPYRLGGWSFGAAVAWEIATQLSEAGETIELLALIDGGVQAARGGPAAAGALARDIARSLIQLGVPRRYEDWRSLAQWIGVSLPATFAGWRAASWGARLALLRGIGVDAWLALRVFSANARAGLHYAAGDYRGPCVLFRASGTGGTPGPDRIALGLLGMPCLDLELVRLDGNHMSLMMQDAPCRALAAALTARMG